MKELLQKYKKALLSGAVCLVLALALAAGSWAALSAPRQQPETPQVKPARPLLSFYASIGVALVLVIASVSVLHFRRLIYTPDTAQSQTFVITARTHRQEPAPAESTLAAAAISTHVPEQEEVIYITNHGERYHKGNCTYLIGRDTCPLSISCAVDLGKEPCKICFRNYD